MPTMAQIIERNRRHGGAPYIILLDVELPTGKHIRAARDVVSHVWPRQDAGVQTLTKAGDAATYALAAYGPLTYSLTGEWAGTVALERAIAPTGGGNLLPDPEDFSAGSWVPARAAVANNRWAAPNGSMSADKLVEDSTAAQAHYVRRTFTAADGVYTLSVYARAAERTALQLRFSGPVWVGAGADLATGTLTGNTAGTVASVESAGDGWYRVSLSAALVGGVREAHIVLMEGGKVTYDGDGASGLYLWGAQLETAAEMGPPSAYQPTNVVVGTFTARAEDTMAGQAAGTYRLVAREDFSGSCKAVLGGSDCLLWQAMNFDHELWREGEGARAGALVLTIFNVGGVPQQYVEELEDWRKANGRAPCNVRLLVVNTALLDEAEPVRELQFVDAGIAIPPPMSHVRISLGVPRTFARRVPRGIIMRDYCRWQREEQCPHVAICRHTLAHCKEITETLEAGRIEYFGGFPFMGGGALYG